MGRRTDAALAAVTLAGASVAAAAANAPVDPAAILAGAAGAIALEGLLSLDASRVRRLWTRPAVKLVAVALTAFGGAAGTVVLGPAALTALCAGLAAYLLLLGLASARDRLRGRSGAVTRRRN